MTSRDMLRKVQQQLGVSQKDLGVYIGVSIRTVNSWMTGERECPSYVAEATARIAEMDLRAIREGQLTSGMMRWALITSYGNDEWIDAFGSKVDAMRWAEKSWKQYSTKREREALIMFRVGLVHLCLNMDGGKASFTSYEGKAGQIDGDVYEIAKDYLEK